MKKYYTVKAAGDELRRSKGRIQQLIRSGEAQAIKFEDVPLPSGGKMGDLLDDLIEGESPIPSIYLLEANEVERLKTFFMDAKSGPKGPFNAPQIEG